MPAGLGKFENEPAETFLLWGLSLDSGYDEETGDVETGAWRCIFRGPVSPVDVESQFDDAREYGYTDTELVSALVSLSKMAGAILTTNDLGFIWGDVYGVHTASVNHTPELLEADWQHYVDQDAALSDKEEDQ